MRSGARGSRRRSRRRVVRFGRAAAGEIRVGAASRCSRAETRSREGKARRSRADSSSAAERRFRRAICGLRRSVRRGHVFAGTRFRRRVCRQRRRLFRFREKKRRRRAESGGRERSRRDPRIRRGAFSGALRPARSRVSDAENFLRAGRARRVRRRAAGRGGGGRFRRRFGRRAVRKLNRKKI